VAGFRQRTPHAAQESSQAAEGWSWRPPPESPPGCSGAGEEGIAWTQREGCPMHCHQSPGTDSVWSRYPGRKNSGTGKYIAKIQVRAKVKGRDRVKIISI
jgi:hypothetical protein